MSVPLSLHPAIRPGMFKKRSSFIACEGQGRSAKNKNLNIKSDGSNYRKLGRCSSLSAVLGEQFPFKAGKGCLFNI